MIKCENCGIDNEDGAEVCSLCSHPLSVKLVCKNCGAELKPHWLKCPKCQTPVTLVTADAPKEPPVCSCGEPLEEGWEVCPACGKAVGADNPANGGGTADVNKLLRNKAIENIILKHLAKTDYLKPRIPKNKLNNAIDSYITLDEDEYVIYLYDGTYFGSAKEGLALTNSSLQRSYPGGGSGLYIDYTDIKEVTVGYDDLLRICDHTDEIHNITSFSPVKFKQALDEIVSYINEGTEEKT